MRGYCSVVEGDCLAPAGYRAGSGFARAPQATGLRRCGYCGEPVCTNCSNPIALTGERVCVTHDPGEISSLEGRLAGRDLAAGEILTDLVLSVKVNRVVAVPIPVGTVLTIDGHGRVCPAG